jgi:hypothetical protein
MVIEAGAGLALLGVPSRFAQLLLAAPLEGAVALTARQQARSARKNPWAVVFGAAREFTSERKQHPP